MGGAAQALAFDDDAGVDGFVLLVLREVVPDMGAVSLDHAEIRHKIKTVLFERIVNALTKPVKPRAMGLVARSARLIFDNPGPKN